MLGLFFTSLVEYAVDDFDNRGCLQFKKRFASESFIKGYYEVGKQPHLRIIKSYYNKFRFMKGVYNYTASNFGSMKE